MPSNLFTRIRNTWGQIVQFSIWLIIVAGSFIIEPPLLSYTLPSNVGPVTKFIIAAITALALIPLSKRSANRDYKLWLWLAIILFFITTAVTITYSQLLGDLSEPFSQGTRLVKGNTMLLPAKKFVDSAGKARGFPISDQEFLQQRIGRNDTIWPVNEIKLNFKKLVTLYTLNIIVFEFFLLFMTQALYCFNRTNRPANNENSTPVNNSTL